MTFTVTTFPGWNTPNGQHSVELVMALKGAKGAMVWRLALGISPIGYWPSVDTSGPSLYRVNLSSPYDMGLTAHSELSLDNASEEDYKISETCEYLEGRACCCDYQQFITGLMSILAAEGFAGIERELRKRYAEHYGEEA
jgi:hypothetical protein